MACEGLEEDPCWALYDQRISPDLWDPDTKQTALHLAAARGCVGCVRLLMEAGRHIQSLDVVRSKVSFHQ